MRRQDEVSCTVDPDIFNQKLRSVDVLLVDLKYFHIFNYFGFVLTTTQSFLYSIKHCFGKVHWVLSVGRY